MRHELFAHAVCRDGANNAPEFVQMRWQAAYSAGTGAMVASQFDWTTALMVLGLLVAMVCVFYTRA
jgi:hypothetical protein